MRLADWLSPPQRYAPDRKFSTPVKPIGTAMSVKPPAISRSRVTLFTVLAISRKIASALR